MIPQVPLGIVWNGEEIRFMRDFRQPVHNLLPLRRFIWDPEAGHPNNNVSKPTGTYRWVRKLFSMMALREILDIHISQTTKSQQTRHPPSHTFATRWFSPISFAAVMGPTWNRGFPSHKTMQEKVFLPLSVPFTHFNSFSSTRLPRSSSSLLRCSNPLSLSPSRLSPHSNPKR